MSVSESTDHENEWTFCSDSILVLSSHNYGEIAKDRAQVPSRLTNRELHFVYDAMQT